MKLRVAAILLTLAMTLGLAAQWKEDFSATVGGLSSGGEIKDAGAAAFDLLPGNGSGFGYALRYAGIVPGSESVEVAGRHLRRDVDYTIDYPSGSLTFTHAVKAHESAQISYRHSDKLAGAAKTFNLPLISLQFGNQSGIKALYSMNGAERLADGSVRQRMSYGLTNRFHLGQGMDLGGLYFFSSQKGMRAFANPASPETRQGAVQREQMDHFFSQSLNLKMSGFHGGVDYREIGSNFNGFEAMQGADGIASDVLNQWQKEKGVTRLGYNFGYGQGKNDFSTSFLRISDGFGNVEKRGANLTLGASTFYWNTRWVDPTFRRFGDLAEGGEAAQWGREKGITRESMGGALAFTGATLKYDQNQIKDGGGELQRRDLAIETQSMKLSHYEQSVDSGFTRFNDLAEGEKGQWVKERGFKRTGFTLQLADVFRRKNLWNSYAENRVHTSAGDLLRRNMAFGGVGFGVSWLSTSVEAGFGGLASLRPDEQESILREIKTSYNPADTNLTDKDRQFLVRQVGLERDYKRFTLDQKFGKIDVDMLGISDDHGDVRRWRFNFGSKSLSLNYLDQSIDPLFGRLGDLLDVERAAYGNGVGLRHTLMLGSLTLPKGGALTASQLAVSGETGGLGRQSFNLRSGNYDLTATFRRVDDTFLRSMDVPDPEKQLLADLRGYEQSDLTGKIRLMKNLSLELFHFDANNTGMNVDRSQTKYFVNWAPDKLTSVTHLNDRLRAASQIQNLNDYMHEKTTLARNLGKLGKFTGFQEREASLGSLMNGVERTTQYWKYEGSPIGGYALTEERLTTTDTAGNSEAIQLHGISGKATKRLTLSFSEKTIERDEKRADESHTTYAVGYDLGKGMSVNYAFTRALNSMGRGRALQSWALSQSVLGNLQFSAAYNEDRMDATNTKAGANIGISTPKPFRIGPLRNAQFSLGYQSQADQTVWKQENKLASASADWGTNKLAWSYSGVITPSGDRAVDRTFSFSTNADAKLPFHMALSHKIRTLPGGVQQIIRNYHLDYKVGDRFTLVHDLASNPERHQDNVPFSTVINPTGTANWALTWKVNRTYDLTANYLTTYDFTKAQIARRGGMTLTTKTGTGLNLWQVGYSVEGSTLNGRSAIAHTVSVGYSFNLNPLNSISFGVSDTQYQHFTPAERSRNSLAGKVDYTLRF